MDKKEFLNYWNYYLSIDKSLQETLQYVEHSEENFNTYSNEFARLILVSCAEIDTICRLLCKAIDSSNSFEDEANKNGNIKSYASIILTKYPLLIETEIKIDSMGYKIKPWEGWVNGEQYKSPSWWVDYNKIKHYRHKNFNKATLKNTISAVAGLLVVLMYLHKKTFAYTGTLGFDSPKYISSLALADFNREDIEDFRCEQLPDFR